MALRTPDWRKGATYSRPLTDADGLVTGREVCVFTKEDHALLVEGVLGGSVFDKAWFYKILGEAVRAAEEWDGLKSPNGDWFDYKCRDNGDFMVIPEAQEPTEAERFANLARKFSEIEPTPFQRIHYGSASVSYTKSNQTVRPFPFKPIFSKLKGLGQ